MERRLRLHNQRRMHMFELSKKTRMIIASNLTIAAAIREAAMAMKSGPQANDSHDKVTQIFTSILAGLESLPEVTNKTAC
jgi:cation transport ATPase